MELALTVFGGNPVELQILLACAVDDTSASQIAPTKDTIAKTSYHFRALTKDGLIRFKREEKVRGAVAKYYVATAAGKRLLRELGLPEDASA